MRIDPSAIHDATANATEPAPLPSPHGTVQRDEPVARAPAPAGVDAHADERLARFLAAADAPPKLGDGVLYVGMNSDAAQCDREAAAVRTTGPGTRRMVEHGERQAGVGADQVRLAGGAVVDLSTEEGARAFADSLGLREEQTAQVAHIVLRAAAGSRDEVAGLARVFAESEQGRPIPSRLVLSGHSTGRELFDGGTEDLGALQFAEVFALAHVMPRAASEIEDIMLSACSTGYRGDTWRTSIDAWREHFPSLKTVWAYGGERDYHSPTGDVAIAHVRGWELATRGRQETLAPAAAIARANGGERVGFEANVATWTVGRGFVPGR